MKTRILELPHSSRINRPLVHLLESRYLELSVQVANKNQYLPLLFCFGFSCGGFCLVLGDLEGTFFVLCFAFYF